MEALNSNPILNLVWGIFLWSWLWQSRKIADKKWMKRIQKTNMAYLSNLSSLIWSGGVASKNRLAKQTKTNISQSQGLLSCSYSVQTPTTSEPKKIIKTIVFLFFVFSFLSLNVPTLHLSFSHSDENHLPKWKFK